MEAGSELRGSGVKSLREGKAQLNEVLLLHRREIERSIGKTAERELTLMPTGIYFKGPRAKVELALTKGNEGRGRRGGARLQAALGLSNTRRIGSDQPA